MRECARNRRTVNSRSLRPWQKVLTAILSTPLITLAHQIGPHRMTVPGGLRLDQPDQFRERILTSSPLFPVRDQDVEFLRIQSLTNEFLRSYEFYLGDRHLPLTSQEVTLKLQALRAKFIERAGFVPSLPRYVENTSEKKTELFEAFIERISAEENGGRDRSKEVYVEPYLHAVARSFVLTLDQAAAAVKNQDFTEARLRINQATLLLMHGYLTIGKTEETSEEKSVLSVAVSFILTTLALNPFIDWSALLPPIREMTDISTWSLTSGVNRDPVGTSYLILQIVQLLYNTKAMIGWTNERIGLPKWLPEPLGYQLVLKRVRASLAKREDRALLTSFWEDIQTRVLVTHGLVDFQLEIRRTPPKMFWLAGPQWFMRTVETLNHRMNADVCGDLFTPTSEREQRQD